MGAFKYIAFDASGKKISGEIEAGSVEEAERRLGAQDVTVLSVVEGGGERSPRKKSKTFVGRGRRVSAADAGAVLSDLSVMAETGVPLVDALNASISSAKTPNLEGLLRTIRSQVVAGKSLSAAMKDVPNFVPVLVTDMVRVAEEGGRLYSALANAAGYLERAASLRKKILNALLYPLVMLSISALTIVVLIVFVMPRFGQIFTKMNADVPASTKFLLALGNFVRDQPWVVVFGSIGVVVCLRLLSNTAGFQKLIGAILQRTPVIGPLLSQLALARSFSSISTLLSENVPIIVALEHGAKVAGNRRISSALETVLHDIERGANMADSMNATGVFPSQLVQMVGVGERTGRLASLLERYAEKVEQDVDGKLKAAVSIVEPIMIVFMGAIVGTITVSIITPIYSVVEKVK